MFNRLRERCGLLYARFHFREPDKVLTFTDAVKRARNAMVVLPGDWKQSESARPLMQFMQNRFRGGNLTLVVPENARTIEQQFQRCDIIRLRPDDIGSFSLPKREIVHRVQRMEYDLALDLNLQFSLASAYLCKASRSRLRVGFVTKYADTFFNFQIRTDAARNTRTTYERMATCLGMF
jgi:ADP-heptose:LPS heptosyltransferase